MGVTGLWSLINGRPLEHADLNGLVLSVDLSIWLHRAVHGKAGQHNRHQQALRTLFRRVCSLLIGTTVISDVYMKNKN